MTHFSHGLFPAVCPRLKPIAGALLLVMIPGGITLWAGSELASSSRRRLMDDHRDFLTNQAAHGIQIDRFTASEGTPCRVVSPSGKHGERGVMLRKQLAERGVALPSWGEIVGTLVLAHGRKGRKEDDLPIAERLCAAGFRCVIPDFPGHGDPPAKLATYGVRGAGLQALVLDEAACHPILRE